MIPDRDLEFLMDSKKEDDDDDEEDDDEEEEELEIIDTLPDEEKRS